MRDEFAIATCPQCGGEVRIPIHAWIPSSVNRVGEQEFSVDLGSPRCIKRCKLTLDEEKSILLTIEDYRWEDW